MRTTSHNPILLYFCAAEAQVGLHLSMLYQNIISSKTISFERAKVSDCANKHDNAVVFCQHTEGVH